MPAFILPKSSTASTGHSQQTDRNTTERFRRRELVTYDPSLSTGAKVLYYALDEYARDAGVCWPRQKTLATRLGCTVREIQYRLRELVEGKFVRSQVDPQRRTNRYMLFNTEQPFGTGTEQTFVMVPNKRSSSSINKKKNQIPPTPASGGTLRELLRSTYPNATETDIATSEAHYEVCGWCKGRKTTGRSEKRQSACETCHGRGFKLAR